MSNDLDKQRQRIDEIDGDLVRLLNERACCAQAIGAAKRATGGSIFVPHREQQVLDKISSQNAGPMPERSLHAIWREIMSASFSLEHPLTICHFGQPGSFTHEAARLKFGEGVSYASVEAISTVFTEIERGHADYGVVPIENSTDGGISDTIDAFLQTSLRIVNECYLRIRHHLMARCDRNAIQRVYSKHTVFGQCRTWLSTNLPKVELVETGSTTLAAERAAEDPQGAAIGNKRAATAFDLGILAEDIEDNPQNTTRFVILASPDKAAQASGNDKTSLMFGIQDKPGALYESLTPFHSAGISLSRIESRPNRRQPWEYLFFIDCMGHESETAVADAIASLRSCSTNVQILGSYPSNPKPLND